MQLVALIHSTKAIRIVSTCIQEVHLDEAALLRNQMKERETRRILLMLIAIPATILPTCCCLWICRQIWVARNKMYDKMHGTYIYQ